VVVAGGAAAVGEVFWGGVAMASDFSFGCGSIMRGYIRRTVGNGGLCLADGLDVLEERADHRPHRRRRQEAVVDVDRGGHWPGLGVPVRDPRGRTQRLDFLGVRSGPHEMGRNNCPAQGNGPVGSWFSEVYNRPDGQQRDTQVVSEEC
jgi:hypothetical protein